ncbi:MAG: hypothetical protein ABDH21_04785 [bacterium]
MYQSSFTIIITIILAILTILLGLQYYKDYSKTKKEQLEKTIFEKKLDKKIISTLIIYNSSSKKSRIELVKKNEFWFVYPIDDIAYSYMVDNIISSIYQPTVNEVIPFSKEYYNQFFKTSIDVYFTYNKELYHVKRGIKNDFTSETYLWVNHPIYKHKIYVVSYWDFNYLDKTIDEFRMKKVLNIDQQNVNKLIVNNQVIYKEEIKKVKKKDLEEDQSKIIWKVSDGTLVSRDYINSLFAVLNNYDFKQAIPYQQNQKKVTSKKLVANIKVITNDKKEYAIQIYEYDKDGFAVICSYRKYVLILPSFEVKEWLNKQMIEKKIFSYYIENFDDFDTLYVSDSRAKFKFIKKEGNWFSPKNEEKTSLVNMLINTLRDLEYHKKFDTNPLNSKYELYTIELVGKEKHKIYLYNPDYLSYGSVVYKVNNMRFVLKSLLDN